MINKALSINMLNMGYMGAVFAFKQEILDLPPLAQVNIS